MKSSKSWLKPDVLHPVADGPLRGESHALGESFEYEGHYLGQEDGTYRLLEGEYRWERATIPIRPDSR